MSEGNLCLALALTLLLLAACTAAARPTVPPTASPPPEDPTQPPPCTQVGQAWTSPIDGATLVCVPAGTFLMGASEAAPQAHRNEKPQRAVYLDAFWIDRTEVSNARFARCVAEGSCHPRTFTPYSSGVASQTRIDYYGNPDYDVYPALIYDADQAQAYCRWAGRQLPSEAQWEKAARGTDGRTYPWGQGLDCARASYNQCADDTAPVDAYPGGASPYGALNMAGNVWEWVADVYDSDYYANAPSRNPTGPTSPEPGSDYRVRRGGGFRSLAQDLRATSRASGAPRHYFDGQMGFRCALDSR